MHKAKKESGHERPEEILEVTRETYEVVGEI
jgi:hypothetical protein